MILTAEPITAAQALDRGLVQRVVPRDQLDAEAEAMARRLLSMPQSTVRLAKRALVEGADLPLAVALRLEARMRSLLNA